MQGILGPKKSEDSEGPSFFWKLFTSIIALLSSVIEGGHIKTQSTPTPPVPEKFRVGDNFRRWEFQAKEYVFLFAQAEKVRVLAILLDGEALEIAIDENILQAREQRILQQTLEGTRDPSTRRAFLTAAPTSIQEALDRAGTIEQVNGVSERDQQYRIREIAPVQDRPLTRPQPFNRQEHYGPQRMQRPPYQKPHCYYCSLYGKRTYRCGYNRGESATRPLSKLMCPSLLLNNSHVRSPTVSGLLWSTPSVLLLDTGDACCLNKHRVPRQVLPQQDSGVGPIAANGTGIRSVGWLNVLVTLVRKCVNTRCW
ncbi:hypothetical protein EG68_03737 [Paragonimus skrjabini miyazakii]|uniref:Uncharacterized protein n=1 Tax=Paragonimus skrjabini miyazakii TaxID=59628 RepID=A0A8S9YZV1_9TREM|nr:hypothetical protein EG68_03737 [Paragonimus skrjabini miyazakii]